MSMSKDSANQNTDTSDEISPVDRLEEINVVVLARSVGRLEGHLEDTQTQMRSMEKKIDMIDNRLDKLESESLPKINEKLSEVLTKLDSREEIDKVRDNEHAKEYRNSMKVLSTKSFDIMMKRFAIAIVSSVLASIVTVFTVLHFLGVI